jgi:hypothetical protein
MVPHAHKCPVSALAFLHSRRRSDPGLRHPFASLGVRKAGGGRRSKASRAPSHAAIRDVSGD